ncbi:MAG: DeoR/GlpR transcriptional regulator [Oscillospiraceae bacterium]|nr:DeoR/GlpR transcriptional regulator [Oscillospiraceae bacterium]
MKKTERHEHILMEALRTSEKMTLSDAMNLLKVSESTARRLFCQMESHGNVIRVHGGIQFVGPTPKEYSYDIVEGRNTIAKRKIALAAAELIQDGDIIFLDSGSTLAYLSEAIAEKLKSGKLNDLVIFTNSLVNLNYLCNETRVTIIGGYYRDNRKDFCGYVAEETAKSLNFTKCFLGTDGYSIHTGFTAIDFSTARLNEVVLSRSAYRVVMADTDKFHGTTVVSYSRNQQIHLLITDQLPEDAVRAEIESGGTTISVPD